VVRERFRERFDVLAKVSRRRWRPSRELLAFCVVGGSGVLINTGLLLLLSRVAGLRLELASPLAIEGAILWNYALNDRWTFRRRAAQGSSAGRLLRFHLVSAASALINYGLLLVLVRTAGMRDLAANLIGIAVGTFINYGANSLWTWRTPRPAAAP
jgi:dolichol-phosphate mannosyltransferase